MFLGEQINSKESLHNEYKEFCIKSNIYDHYRSEELNNIIRTGKIDKCFNNIINENLQLYFNIYVPKYASAFSNSNVKNGNIQIGVNDQAEVTGIPYYGNLDKEKIQCHY